MHEILQRIGEIGIVPVVKIDDADKAAPLAGALKAGGIPLAEITFRTDAAEESIRRIAKAEPDVLLGAGTVLTTEQVDRAAEAGAQFIVSPGFNPAVVEHCLKKGILITPGCSTPSDMEKALEYGLDVVKFFPAEASGGLDYLRAVAAPYAGLTFMPTGGISPKNIKEYLAFDRILACGGSWMVKEELIQSESFEEIARLCRQAIQDMLGFHLIHMGINTASQEEALPVARMFETLFGFQAKQPGPISVFAGTEIEVMFPAGNGEKGHIGIGTNSVERAKAYLSRQGVAFREDTAKTDAAGHLTIIYLQQEIAGFAIHLLRKNP